MAAGNSSALYGSAPYSSAQPPNYDQLYKHQMPMEPPRSRGPIEHRLRPKQLLPLAVVVMKHLMVGMQQGERDEYGVKFLYDEENGGCVVDDLLCWEIADEGDASLKPGDVLEVKGPIEKLRYSPNLKKTIDCRWFRYHTNAADYQGDCAES